MKDWGLLLVFGFGFYERMRFHLCLQRNNLKANGMMKILMTLISRNHGRMKMNLLRLQYNGLHCNLY
ncbi:fadA [Gossypium arboreum]|uniref:FadA n=1 Tax=Gossypium arboreum TaxID=29729 RepID=A0A0B0NJ60_GOSAR|nr:fadA [Gossypium arboreum]